jgi:hypothetical protein
MASAEHNVLLDYVSPPLPIVFWRALRASHFVVALSVLVFFLLKVVTIISTTHLILQQTETPSIEISLLTKTKFDASNHCLPFQHSLSSKIFFETYAYLAVDVAYPEGLTADAVYQSLASAAGSFQTRKLHLERRG